MNLAQFLTALADDIPNFEPGTDIYGTDLYDSLVVAQEAQRSVQEAQQ